MVNYKRVVCEVAVLLALLAVAIAAPTHDCTEHETHYDQRQNGTENYRLNIDGVVIAVAPAESIIEAAAEFGDLFDISDIDDFLKPPSPPSSGSTTKPEVSDSKPGAEKPAETPLSDVSLNSETKPQRKDASAGKQEKVQRLKHRLANVLIPLLRRTRHH
ncbi:uncharacterized protein LOC120624662 [Pararge aegeria]|uniref:uncharacterized protein LOC120624662 n=1 Tax=Pararge aegeria TaxID=116150 RepID=UPI0019CFFF75|nr:uncharacterized protein LOC120624662 [Pararge aegeria]